ncbi:translation initiation factor IF-2 [Silvanigrella paludirubra]|uniref:Translation initiation factor IF-2 n=1 Tax=Silvanigrella paludirubra TaxID=2499159 RepID=A0A6N6VQ48_9BACT|nr:translation initiation factor IF-2 [Silvanigrella paludirubra]KAB8037086.1 translation initiation factor IF-2 [Silvanigrella paludirubra]
MSRIRVLDLAKELGIETKAAIIKLQELGIQVKNHFNAISETEAAKLRAFHRSGKNPEKEAAQKAAASKLIIRRKVEVSSDSHEDVAPKSNDDMQLNEQTTKKTTIIKKASASSAKAHDDESSSTNSLKAKKEEPKHRIEEDSEEGASDSTHHQKVLKTPAGAGIQSTTQDSRETTAASAQAQEASAGRTNGVFSDTPKGSEVGASAMRSQESDEINNVQTTNSPSSSNSAQVVRPASTVGANAQNNKSTSPAPKMDGGAVIVRKAEPAPVPQPASKPQSYTTASFNAQNSYRRDDNNAPRSGAGGSGRDSGRSPQGQGFGGGSRDSRYQGSSTGGGQGGRPGMGASGGGQGRPQGGGFGGARDNASGQGSFRTGAGAGGAGAPRPAGQGFGGDRGGFSPRPGGAAAPGSRPFVMGADAAPTTPTKDVPSRLKDRDKDKDREKRRISEEEDARRIRAKNARRLEETEEDLDIYTEVEGGEDQAVVVRTMIPNRKKTSQSFKKKEIKKTEAANPTKASKKIVRVDESITVNDLAGELSQKASAVIKVLMKLGMSATINQQLDLDTATFVAQEFGFETQSSSISIGDILSRKTVKNDDTNTVSRPPIITIMGHVDHGKTSLLDAIRSANVAAKEAGGITQHIGAYQIDYKGQKLTFLDTPGHEAFTAMRARGAQVTDIVVLVVAADDGVMPQTSEAIAHAKAAGVPIIVAINKIDKPGANLDRINRELSEQGVMPEEWGGESIFVQVSAKTHQGLNDLIESILLQAEVLDLKASKDTLAEGIVIEAKLDKARGPVATVIVTKGSLKQQDFIVVGTSMGRVRAMNDASGNKITVAEPATPVEIIGLSDVPASGDQFNCVVSDAIAKEAVAYRIEKQRQKDLSSQRASSMDELLAMMSGTDDKAQEVSIIIKADTHGSAEAIRASLLKLDTPKVKTKILHAAVGGITETDVILAKASNALILGFNVRPDRVAAQVAEQGGIKIQCYSIIYELIEAVQAAMVGTLAPIKQDKVIGHAEVRNTFSVPKVGVIAGSMISDGKVVRNSHVRIVRDGVVIYTGRIGSLKRFKDDAKEVAQGFECGIGVENYNDIKVGDILEAFIVEEIAATLN